MDAQQRRQQLCDEAYYLVLKTFMFKEKTDTALLTQMRMELSIPNESHRQWIQELITAKRQGTLNTRADGPLSYQQPTYHQPQPRQGAAPRNRINPAEAARKFKAQNAAQAVQHAPPPGLPANPVHFKVQFYRKVDGWQEGLITEYIPEAGKIRVNMLNTKKVEMLDYQKSNCLVVHDNERVTDLSNYV